MTKEKALEIINKMPDDFSMDELVERIIFMDKVEQGLAQLDEGKGISHEEVENIVRGWVK